MSMIIPFSARALAVAMLVSIPASAFADETAGASDADALDPLRERFRAGMDKYRAGSFAEAILIWDGIYVELGPEKGYRLAYNIARACEQFGDSTRAAEHYEAYVTETSHRRATGQELEPIVEKQETEARARLVELSAMLGRIRIAGDRAAVVKIDGGKEHITTTTGFVAYVTPDRSHFVTFDPGTKGERRVETRVARGELVELGPPRIAPAPAPAAPAVRYEMRTERPYGSTVLYVGAAATAISLVLPLLLRSNANSVSDEYYTARSARSVDDQRRLESDYYASRDAYYASFAVPALLGAATLALTGYWFFGTKETRVQIGGRHPTIAPTIPF